MAGPAAVAATAKPVASQDKAAPEPAAHEPAEQGRGGMLDAGIEPRLGNQALGSLLRRRANRPVQSIDMPIAASNDAQEREADAMALRVAGSRDERQPRPVGDPKSVVGSRPSLGAGTEIESSVRGRFENAMGVRLPDVRVHTDAAAAESAQRLSAAAYAVGSHIVFAPGGFAPNTSRGAWLLAHELTHVVQHERGAPAVLHRAPEDVPALDEKFYNGVAKGGENGFRDAAEALNYFAEFDITRRLSNKAPDGRPVLTRSQIASIHMAAVRHPHLGAGSNAAKFTHFAYLDLNYLNEMALGHWQQAAEYLNAFSESDMMERLHHTKLSDLSSLQLGALQNPKLGVKSAIAINVEKAIHEANQKIIEDAAKGSPDLNVPKSNAPGGPPGKIGFIGINAASGDPRIPAADQEQLDQNVDWSSDPAYIDNGIVHAYYDVLANLFTLVYADGKELKDLDYDEVLKGAAGGPAVKTYIRNKANKRIYPTRLGRTTVPTITACAVELHRKEPEARERLKNALIDLAVAAHGVGTATLKVNQSLAGSTSSGKGQPKSQPKEAAPESAGAKPGRTAGPSEGGSTGTTGRSAGGTAKMDEPGGVTAAPQGRGAPTTRGGATEGGLQRVAPSVRAGPPTEGVPEPGFMKSLPPGARFGAGFAAQKAAGEIMLEAERLGPGILVSAEAGARVVGATTVAQGALKVGAFQMLNAMLVTGGKFAPAGATAGRTVLYALVFGDVTRLVVSSPPGTDEPVHAPGADSTPAHAPGTDSSAVKAPGKETGPVQAPGTGGQGPIAAPGAVVDDAAECKKLNGAKRPHRHHVFPQQFRKEFAELGIFIDNFTVELPATEHIGRDGVHINLQWNEQWADFLEDLPHEMSDTQRRNWAYKAVDHAIELMGAMQKYLNRDEMFKLVKFGSGKPSPKIPPK